MVKWLMEPRGSMVDNDKTTWLNGSWNNVVKWLMEPRCYKVDGTTWLNG